MAVDEGARCPSCPLDSDDCSKGSPDGRLCWELIEYPVTLRDGQVTVEIGNEDEFCERLTEFTEELFGSMGSPGVDIHPRAFLRVESGTKRRTLCPHSFPIETWARLAMEQVVSDTSGMQPRWLYNELPWLKQPAIYTDCVSVVQRAKKVADDWIAERNKKRSE
jgi:hypothetical protein